MASRCFILSAVLLLVVPGIPMASQERETRGLMVEGQSGQAPVIKIGGHNYVALESLVEIIHGSLIVKDDHIVLRLPSADASGALRSESVGEAAIPSMLSHEFVRDAIELISAMREWASTIAYAIQNGYQITDKWAADYREQAANDLRLASAAASTDADRSALQLLTHEFETLRGWSEKLLQERKRLDTAKYAVSPSSLRDDPVSQKIVSCGHFLGTMLASGSFQDGAACH